MSRHEDIVAGPRPDGPVGWPPIFHLALAADWAAAESGERAELTTSTRGVPLDVAGFVHMSYAEQVPGTASAVFTADDDVVLLAVDPARAAAEVRVEEGFPHLYGPLPVAAVLAARPYAPDPTGRWPQVGAERTVRIAAYTVVLDRGRLLLTRLSERTGRPGAWTLPGGGLDHGEAPAEAARRETHEETGQVVEVGDLLGVDSRHWIGWFGTRLEDHHGLRLVYRAVADDAGAALTVHDADGSTDAAAWVPLADLGRLPVVDLVPSALALADRHAPPDATRGPAPEGARPRVRRPWWRR